MFKERSKYLLFLGLFFLLPLKMSAAGTTVSSSITNPVWTAENSPYIISGTIEVTKGAVLKIEAGTEIRFNPGAKILVNGELDVNGTTDNPVMMTLNTASSTTGIWNGIEFTPDSVDATMADGQYVSGSIIKNAIIRFGTGIKCDDASPYIANNQIMNNSIGLEITGDNASVGGLVYDLSSANTNAGLVTPLYVSNNIFTDNTVGLSVNRNNGQNYVDTPGGYSYVGSKIVTSYINNNSFNSNGAGVRILNGDSNVLIGNSIKYNSVVGVQAASASRNNAIEKNSINNNEIGLDIASPDTIILQNNIKNNFSAGLKISQRPKLFELNNFSNNKSGNLTVGVMNLEATGNYWGSTAAATIVSSFSVGSSTPVVYDPYLTKEADITAVIDPIIDNYDLTTLADKVNISGVKPADVNVYVNGAMVVADNGSSAWVYKANLVLGDNSFTIYYVDATGKESAKKTITIRRNNELPAPTFEAYTSTTSAASITIRGSKPAGASIIINDKEAIASDATTAWTYTFPLAMGANAYEVVAKDNSGQYSAAISLNVTRVKDNAGDIIAAEKKNSTKADAKASAKLAGRLLLQVENGGLIWYVNPKNNQRYLVTMDSALSLFKALSVGISENNLNLIPTKESGAKGNAALRQKMKGKFLLRVEKGGQIVYVDLDGYRHDIVSSNLMSIFKSLSLGISNANIRKITVNGLK